MADLSEMLDKHIMKESVMRIPQLRVKIKSLASEAQHIRHEERRATRPWPIQVGTKEVPIWTDGTPKSNPVRLDLMGHRKDVVRLHARASLLAYAYLRGVPYRKVEACCHDTPRWDLVWKDIRTFGGTENRPQQAHQDNHFQAWRTATE